MRKPLLFPILGFVLLSLAGSSWGTSPTPGYQKFQDIKVGGPGSGASGDKNEMASRYEEYVLILP